MKTEVFIGKKEPFIADAFFVRDVVFTQEQGYAKEIDIDSYDDEAIQTVLYNDDNAPIGTARMVLKEDGTVGKIGRVAIVKPERGKNYGLMIMQSLIDYAHNHGIYVLTLHAQTHAQGFYKKLNFEVIGDEFTEDGAPHIRMDHNRK